MKIQYNLTNITMVLGGNTIYLDEKMILSMMIMDDYMHRKVPIIRLDLGCNVELMNKIMTHEGNPSIIFDVYEEYIDTDTEELIDTKLLFKNTFSSIPLEEKTKFKILEDLPGIPSSQNMDQYHVYQSYLIKIDELQYMNKESSFIFKNTSKPDILKSLFESRNIPKGISIVTPPDTSIVTQADIPQGDLIANINYLNDRHGLYRSTPLIYKDMFSEIYCLCTNKPNIILPDSQDEYNLEFVVPDDRDINKLLQGFVIDDELKVIRIQTNFQPIVKDRSTNISDTSFSTVMGVNQYGTVNKTTLDENSDKLKYVYETNPLTIDRNINDGRFEQQTIEINMDGMPIRFFKPYKICKVIFPTNLSSIYNMRGKNFMIYNMMSYFTRNGDRFNINTSLMLKIIEV